MRKLSTKDRQMSDLSKFFWFPFRSFLATMRKSTKMTMALASNPRIPSVGKETDSMANLAFSRVSSHLSKDS